MSNFLVSGLINLETTLLVEGFPIPYYPVHYPFFGVRTTVSGVGYNVARALTVLGDDVVFLSLIGDDSPGFLVQQSLQEHGIRGEGVLPTLDETAQSVILYDGQGRRQIHTDLKDIQSQGYPFDRFEMALQGVSCAVLCNINFSRPFLKPARMAGKLVATDVHAVCNIEDEYNRDFIASAHILFLSDERLPTSPEEFVRRIWDKYPAEVVVVGLGERGALLGLRNQRVLERFPARHTRPVVSTIGAGDSLFSSFLHFYLKSKDPYSALEKAQLFASYKIGEPGAANGFLDEAAVEGLYGGRNE